jgi:hypothetical protein
MKSLEQVIIQKEACSVFYKVVYRYSPAENEKDARSLEFETGSVPLREPARYTTVYRKVPGLAAWSEDCQRYSSLHLGAVVSLFCESV